MPGVSRLCSHDMKTPAALEPEFAAEDWALVEQIEADVEEYFQDAPDGDYVDFIMQTDESYRRRHWSEFAKRARAAGWIVTVDGLNLRVSKPSLGGIESRLLLVRG